MASLALYAPSASALQPLSEFLDAAKTYNPDNRVARATTAAKQSDIDIQNGNLEPNLQFNGFYTRNQYQVDTSTLLGSFNLSSLVPAGTMVPSFPNEVIQPQNQFDGNITLQVPIINIATWERRSVAKASLEAAKADEVNWVFTVAKNVTRNYFLVSAYEAVLTSAMKNLEVTQSHLKLSRDRKDAGTGSELDVQRAIADAAKAEQTVTASRLNVINARRDLQSLTGIEPLATTTFIDDDLHGEPPLNDWMAGVENAPAIKSAVASRKSAERASHAARRGWLPTVTGLAEEKFTNATAFSGGHSAYYLFQIAANWRLDNTILPQIDQQYAYAAQARAVEDKTRRASEDSIFKDWHQIEADIQAARSTRAQVVAAKLAASLAEDRYQSGVATQLDVLQARQDAFAADVARIQADADLAYARAALRIDSGRSPTEDRR